MGAPNASGLTRIAQKLKDKFAAKAHNHAASDINSGTLALARGGTGASTAAGARTNLDAAQSDGASGTLALAESAIGNLGSSIATVEQTTATANHAAGDYFVLGNVLMRATSAIATGEQITASNAVPATLQSQIDTLRDSVATARISLPVKQSSMSSSATLQVHGKMVFLYASFNSSTAIPAGTVLYEVPDGFRPASEVKLLGIIRQNTSNNLFMFNDIYVRTTGGVVQIATNNCFGCIMFGMWEIA